MNQLGLALSGGGFRATMYHLGIIRFLRDANLLTEVTHISSVSGGSILAAHLALNWDAYCGSDEEFDQVAGQLIRFAKLDVRNRIVRRYPLCAALNALPRLLGRPSNRRLTRPGLLEHYYEKHLFGDKCLFQLPQKPELHVLATNLSEGCLCSFNRQGLSVQTRDRGDFQHVPAGLATVAMAVTASSAFPGFFPPLVLRAWDVGENEGEFDTQAFTDGGVFDNLGVRFFKVFESIETPFDRIIVSDAGGMFKVVDESATGGLIKTALRASDILMNRVWSLELEHFEDKDNFTFASIANVVNSENDPHAPHMEVQRHTARIRTDLDSFSDLEIRSLVRHGYCVMRHACRQESEVYGDALPDGPPWDPIAACNADGATTANLTAQDPDIVPATRRLQYSSQRKILRKLLNLRDWPTYFWIPLVFLVTVWFPWSFYNAHQQAKRNRMVVEAIADSSPMYRTILDHLESQPLTSLAGMPFESVEQPPPETDFATNIQVVRDTRVIDLRGWTKTNDENEQVYTYRSLRIRRSIGDETNQAELRVRHVTSTPHLEMRCQNPLLKPKLNRYRQGEDYVWDLTLDLRRRPPGKDIDIVIEMLVPEGNSQEGWLGFTVEADTALAKLWVLMPEQRAYDAFELLSYERGAPETSGSEHPSNQLEIPEGDLIAFELISPTCDRFYECHWTWSDPE